MLHLFSDTVYSGEGVGAQLEAVQVSEELQRYHTDRVPGQAHGAGDPEGKHH